MLTSKKCMPKLFWDYKASMENDHLSHQANGKFWKCALLFWRNDHWKQSVTWDLNWTINLGSRQWPVTMETSNAQVSIADWAVVCFKYD